MLRQRLERSVSYLAKLLKSDYVLALVCLARAIEQLLSTDLEQTSTRVDQPLLLDRLCLTPKQPKQYTINNVADAC